MRSPGEQRARGSGNTAWTQRTRPAEQSPEVEAPGFPTPNGRRAGGLERGTAASEGEALKGQGAGEEGTRTGPRKGPDRWPETRRTPGSAAGRNRPARLPAEQAIKAVRNREGGTRPVRWHGRAEAPSHVANPHGRRAQEWTRATQVDGEAIFEQPQERSPVKAGQEGTESVYERQQARRGS